MDKSQSTKSIFFTADIHLWDDDIIEARGFNGARDYAEKITATWNDVVKPDDTVYILGDISRDYPETGVQWIHKHFNGFKVLIPGNHDSFAACQLFQMDPKCAVRIPGTMGTIFETDAGKRIILTHYPVHPDELRFFDGNIHGHIHAPIPAIGYNPIHWPDADCEPGRTSGSRYFNANMEFHNYMPVPLGIIECRYKD